VDDQHMRGEPKDRVERRIHMGTIRASLPL
jgi:hypothetical protein